MLVHQSLDCFMVVVIYGCADNGSMRRWALCVFSDVFHFHLVYVSPVVLLLECLACFCGWLVDFWVEFCIYLF